jgi:hypothetical protein
MRWHNCKVVPRLMKKEYGFAGDAVAGGHVAVHLSG